MYWEFGERLSTVYAGTAISTWWNAVSDTDFQYNLNILIYTSAFSLEEISVLDIVKWFKYYWTLTTTVKTLHDSRNTNFNLIWAIYNMIMILCIFGIGSLAKKYFFFMYSFSYFYHYIFYVLYTKKCRYVIKITIK